MKPDIGYNNVPIMRHEILDDLGRAVDNIDVSPVHPAVLGLERCRKQVVPRATHSLPPRSLRLERVSVCNVLGEAHTKVLLHNHG
jgi:hypothetical protein